MGNNQSIKVKSSANSKILGVLVSFDDNPMGTLTELRVGRWLVTSQPTDLGDFIMIDDPSVSPLHGIIRASANGKLQVLDQLSEYGTVITKSLTGEEIDIAGKMVEIEHGDKIKFGERNFHVCLIQN